MATMNRRTFLKWGTTAVSTTVLRSTPRVWAQADESAETLIRNAVIVTMNPQQPFAEAMAVRNGRILAVGSVKDVEPLASPRTQVVDAGGRCVSPGLIDAHSHLIGFGQMQLTFVILRPPKVHSFATLNRELANAANGRPPGEWIVGRGFDTFQERRFPRRWELDEAVPNHPVLIIHWGGQFGVANTLALRQANLLSASTQDPYGGKYIRDKSGVPDGVLIHYPAIYSVHQPELDDKGQMECAVWAIKQFAGLGVTCIHDNFCGVEQAKVYIRLERSGQLPCRIRVYPYAKNLEHARIGAQKLTRYEGPLVRLQGIKLAVDGYALMYNIPAEHRHLAIPMHPQPQFEEIIATIHRAGLQADVHAVGDKGVDWTLTAYAKASGSAAECRRRRHRIEHYPLRKKDSIKRTADLGVPVCTQPVYVELKANDFAEKLGNKVVDTMLPMRTFEKEGVHVCFGADVPAFPTHSPLDSIRCAMDRKVPGGRRLDLSEAISFMDALRHHTIEGAYTAFDEKELGSLETGKYADFVIWNNDLRRIRTGQEVMALRPEMTFLAGKKVYQAT